MKTKIYCSKKNFLIISKLLCELKLNQNVNTNLSDDENQNFQIYDEILNSLNLKEFDRYILIEELGIGAFMYLTKNKKSIVAYVEDEHSAYMTPLHNNSNVMIVPLATVTVRHLREILKTFLKSKFEAGRHFVRLEMLEKLMEE